MQETVECKLKGRLGTGPEDLKEMRVLNRVVRVSDDGLLYEADPRHAEMLIRAFNLSDAKPVVTPGVKTAVDEDVDPSKVDADISVEIHRMIAELKCPRRRSKTVRFCPHIQFQDVPASSTYYGTHPREFVFTKSGEKFSLDMMMRSPKKCLP